MNTSIPPAPAAVTNATTGPTSIGSSCSWIQSSAGAPPLTGGMNASSSPSFRTTSPLVYDSFTAYAARGRNDWSCGNFSTNAADASATVAPGRNTSTTSDAPARSRRIAKSFTLTRMFGSRSRGHRRRVARRRVFEPDHRDPVPIGQFQHFLTLEHHRLPGFQHETAGAVRGKFLDRRRADRRDVDAEVLVSIGNF